MCVHVESNPDAIAGQEGVQGGPGDCLLPSLGFHSEEPELWLSAIAELPPLQLLVEMVSDLCQ